MKISALVPPPWRQRRRGSARVGSWGVAIVRWGFGVWVSIVLGGDGEVWRGWFYDEDDKMIQTFELLTA